MAKRNEEPWELIHKRIAPKGPLDVKELDALLSEMAERAVDARDAAEETLQSIHVLKVALKEVRLNEMRNSANA